MHGIRGVGLAAGIAALAACGDASRAPSVQVSSDAAPLLDAWADAIGGRWLIAAFPAVHVATPGRDGWFSATGQVRDTRATGGFESVSVYDGARGWRRTETGEVYEVTGKPLADLVTRGFLESHAALIDGRGQGAITRNADGSLHIEPRGGTPVDVTLDPATHRPAEVRWPDVTYGLAEWRSVDGVQMHAHEVYTIGALPFSTLAHGVPPEGAFAAPARTIVPAKLAGSPVTVPLDVDLTHGVLFTAVTIGEERGLPFLVDTGASTIVDAGIAAKLGLTVGGRARSSGSEQEFRGGYARGVTLTLPGVTLGPDVVEVSDLAHVARMYGRPVAGILGAELFSRLVVTLDANAATMTLHDPATFVPPAGPALPVAMELRRPHVDVTLGTRHVPAHLLLDTGCACFVTLTARAARERELHEGWIDAELGGDTLAGRLSVRSGGAFELDTLTGLLGVHVLRERIVTLDVRGGRIWFVPR